MAQHDLSGRQVGKYRLLERIGSGGMAAVYRAQQTNIDRQVAVKIMLPDLARDPDFVRRFEREANTIAQLEHPHILPVYDYGLDEAQQLVYLVTRLMTGGTLEERLVDRGPLSLAEAERVLEQLGGALHHAHQRGVFHRDLKPSNVLLDEFGNVYLTDFGIAKLKDVTALTHTGLVMGTPAYMAPEQWRGDPIDGRADIYALGVLLYQMLTGQLPFDAPTPPQMMYLHLEQEPPLLADKVAGLPAGIDTVVHQALAKDREWRFASAAEMVAAFAGAAHAGTFILPRGQSTARREAPPLPADWSAPATPVSTPLPRGAAPPGGPPYAPPPRHGPGPGRTPPGRAARREGQGCLRLSVALGRGRFRMFVAIAVGMMAVVCGGLAILSGTMLIGGRGPGGGWPIVGALTTPTIDSAGATAGAAAGATATFTPTATETPTPVPTLTPLPPTPTPLPTQPLPPTPVPGFQPAGSNAAWTPIFRSFNGVQMALVPVGCFTMGFDQGRPNERPANPQCFNTPFWIDRFEVTNAQYGSAGAFDGPNRPRDTVTWYEAQRFCQSRGARLPTEAEWEYAARGPNNWIYPWGNTFDENRLVWQGNSGDQTAEVGSRPGGASWVGAQDMSGNLMEWVSSIVDDTFPYPYNGADGRENPNSTAKRGIRGGAWAFDQHEAAATVRTGLEPSTAVFGVGFRCARDYRPGDLN